jgi:septal ring factor EnvC (AmiA/AmiB activator)
LAGIVLAALALLAAQPPAMAQGASGPEETRRRLETDRGRLDATERRSKEIQADLDKLNEERERISARLVETGKQIQQSEVKLGVIESKLGELDAQERQLRGSLTERHGAISALLAALQRMGRNPPPVMMTRREDALGMVRSAMLLSSAFPQLKGQADGLAKELTDLANVIKSSRAEGDRLKAEKARHDEVRIKLAALQDEKRRSGAHQQAELQAVRQEVARIANSVKETTDLLQRLDKEVTARVPPPPAPKTALLAPSGGRLLAPGSMEPNIPFEQTKGTLQPPTQGRRTVSFGQKNHLGIQSKGIHIQARYGGTVFSPCDGRIIYAGEFRTYGQLLIIDPGGGYHILLFGLSQLDVQVGQSVLMGEPVGVMSSAAKSQAGEEGGPVLQVEFRKDRTPIDPEPWWAAEGSRKVQG